MSLNESPASERTHIAFFGRRNAGKSALINAVTGQNLSIVSDVKGTTTDPVKKTMELLPLGPVVITDTPGIDDTGELGLMRVKKTYEILDATDIAVVVICNEISDCEKELIKNMEEKNIPYITVWSKADLKEHVCTEENEISVSSVTGMNIKELKNKIASLQKTLKPKGRIIGDLIEKDDIVILVMPIDEAAPKGRIILPQQQTLRDILDSHANAVCVQTEQLNNVIKKLGKHIKMVVTDSQAFAEVQKIVPEEIPLTSFSILFARYKGNLRMNTEGAAVLDDLSDGDTVLISEACTHHRQCGDIGTEKLPKLIKRYTGKNINFEWTSGNEFPEILEKYRLILHCGGCMINEKQMQSRIKKSKEAGIAMTNYGIAIAKMTGILDRSVAVFDNKY